MGVSQSRGRVALREGGEDGLYALKENHPCIANVWYNGSIDEISRRRGYVCGLPA